ncbi:hypothetical protein [Pseudalkalibacillus hwajinpoensis]|nr:hypothetical protein [Pseudalkalibacillus hwajinpoensis]
MLTINLLFVTIGIRVHERTLEEERHYVRIRSEMDQVYEKQFWMF